MSLFEIIMLLCFGFAWPFSIYRSYQSRSTQGKSAAFLFIVLIGYVAGILNKIVNKPDFVIVFYVINLLLVTADISLYFRNRSIEKNH